MDKRLFHTTLNELKEANPDSISLIEDIQTNFERNIEPITDSEKRALKTYPIQFVKRINLGDGEWTTQLHIWAENGVKDLLDVDPLVLVTKNSYGDTVLMSLINAALGKYTELIDYELINKILNSDFSYEERIKTQEKECIVVKNSIDEKDINNQSIVDCLIDFAFATGIYDKKDQDPLLQQLLTKFAYPENEETIIKKDTPLLEIPINGNIEKQTDIAEQTTLANNDESKVEINTIPADKSKETEKKEEHTISKPTV